MNMVKRYSKLAGVAFSNPGSNEKRQRIISELSRSGKLDAGTELTAVREADNAFDPHAVAVYAPDGRQLGYLPRNEAVSVADAMDHGDRCQVFVTAVTGGDAENLYGVNILIQLVDRQDLKDEERPDEAELALADKSTSECDDSIADSSITSLADNHTHGLGGRNVFPGVENFIKAIPSVNATVIADRYNLYLQDNLSGTIDTLSNQDQTILAFDTDGYELYALAIDFYQGEETCCILHFHFRANLPPIKDVLYRSKLESDKFADSCLRYYDNKLWISSRAFSTQSSLVLFDLRTNIIEACFPFSNYRVKEFKSKGSKVWIIAYRKAADNWSGGNTLFCWNIRTGSCRSVLDADSLSSLYLAEMSTYGSRGLEFKTLVGFCIKERNRTVFEYIGGEEAEAGRIIVKARDDSAFLIGRYRLEFIQCGPGGTQEDPSPDVTTSIHVTNRFTNHDYCKVYLDFEVSSFCIIDHMLYVALHDYYFNSMVYSIDLADEGKIIELLSNGLSASEQAVRAALETNVVAEKAAYQLWCKNPDPFNPEHKRLCKRLSEYDLHYGGYGKCRIKGCAQRARPVVQLVFDDGTDKNFIADIFKNSVSVIDDPDGKKLAELRELIDQAIATPEHIRRMPYRSDRITWVDDYNRLSQIDDFLCAQQRHERYIEQDARDKRTAEQERAAKRKEALLHKNKLIDNVRMHIVLDNEAILGFENRSNDEFYAAYEDFFIAYSEEELTKLKVLVQTNTAQKQYLDYYERVFMECSVDERFNTATLNLYDQYDNTCFDLNKRASFAIEYSKKWFLCAEWPEVERLMQDVLEKKRNKWQKQLGAIDPAWESFESARPYLDIIERDRKAGEIDGPFSVFMDDVVYAVRLETYGSYRISSELIDPLAWVWKVPVSQVWNAAIMNALLRRGFPDDDFSNYYAAAARATVKYG